MKYTVISSVIIALLLCSCRHNKTELIQSSHITAEMAYEGVNNYCHSNYDWSIAEENPSMMYVTMGVETESEHEVIFCSYTGAFVYFYVEKASGTTRMVEHVPTLYVKNEVGTFDLFDYLERKD